MVFIEVPVIVGTSISLTCLHRFTFRLENIRLFRNKTFKYYANTKKTNTKLAVFEKKPYIVGAG